MNNYNQNRNFKNFDDRSFGNKRSFGGGSDRPKMVAAICDKCGVDCELPFKPTGEKPVYCSSCFEQMGGGRNRDDRGGFNRNNDRGGFNRNNDRGGFNRNNDRGGFNRNTSPSRDNKSYQSENNFKKEFEMLGNKLDKIVELLSANKEETPSIKKTPKSKKVEVKKVKKVKVEKKKKEVIKEITESPLAE